MKKLCAAICLTLVFGSCAGAPTVEQEMGPCLMNSEMTAKISMDYEGKSVGFCCEKCMTKFKALSDEEKAAKVAGAMTK